ncbi:hypothetical protein CPB97_006938 [Podila verticillata]|nr:hypothetical protein CPB97_006938 [Podila verticillata]
MTGTFIRAATRLGHQVNARNLSSVSHSGLRLTKLLVVQPQAFQACAPMMSRFAQSSFYSTTKPGSTGSNKDDGYVTPAPASMEEISHSHALQAGSMDAVAPESSISQTTTPPPPPPTGVVGKAKDFLRKGKEIVIQCKDGVKLLWVNKKIVKDLKKAQKENGHQLARREFQLIHKTDIDVKRMIPFGLVFLLATEYIPLIIIFAPQLIPTTCVTPSQLESRRKKIHEKRSVMTEKLIRLNRREITKESLANYNSFMTISKKYGEAFDYEMIDREHLSSFCKFMGLNGFGPKFMLKKRLGKHMDYIRNDDELLQKEGIDGLSFSELQLANEERGMRSLEVSKEHLEKSLAYWLKLSLSKDSTVPPALLVFSRMFLLHSTFKSDTKK